MSIHIAQGNCFHCGLPNDDNHHYSATILGVKRQLCCPGCQAVAQAIVSNGLENYYEFRTEPAERGDAALDNTMAQLAVYDEPELQEEFVYQEGKHQSIQLTVEGITCAACGWLIEKQLSKLEGVVQVSVNVSARRAFVIWDDKQIKLSGVLSRLKSIGYTSLPFQLDQHEASYKKEYKGFLKKLGLAGIMTMQVMMLAIGQYFDILGNINADALAYFNAVSLLLTTPVVIYSASVFYLSAFKALSARTVNMDVPVTLAIFATYFAGVLSVNTGKGEVYFESICMFVFFLLISRFLEHRSRHKATLVSSNMLKLIPVTANKKQDDEFVSVLAKQLVKDDIVLVKAGETVPVDGDIIHGKSSFNESMLTGEFEPVTKQVHDRIFAGSLNQEGSVTIRVSASVKHAMMNQILRLQEQALIHKPHIANFADRLSRYFVVAVLLISASSFAYWHWQGNSEAFWISISILVATCPCALGLATPSALTCAMAKLNQLGILVKRADALEQLTLATDIVFDKTGTLTQGRFTCQKHWINGPLFKTHRIEDPTSYVFSLAKVVESRSEHPIAKAFTYDYTENDIARVFTDADMSDYSVEIGKGVRATLKGKEVVMGSRRMLQEFIQDTKQGITPQTTNETSQTSDVTHSSSHESTSADTFELSNENLDGANVFLASEEGIIAAFWVRDTIVEDAKHSIETLKSKNAFSLSILSGDTQKNAEEIASLLHIEHAVGDSTPQDKLNYIKRLQNNARNVVMLGDGINDAPVLAAADVSIAVGNASDLAKNAADLVLLNPKLQSLIDLIRMAARTKSKIKQNIAWALSYNLLVLPFAIIGYLTPWQAALGMSLSSVIVVYNSTRLMKP